MSDLKYRNGFPTKKSMYSFLENFHKDFSYVGLGYDWGSKSYNHVTLIWQRKCVQDKMEDFIQYASNKGIIFGKYDPYKSPRVGHLQIMKRNASND